MSRPSLLAVAVATLVAGCASTPEPRTARLAPSQDAPRHGEADYMQRVEQIARRRGINVIWINPPRRTKPAVDGAGGS